MSDRIDGGYPAHNKEALLFEVESRQSEGSPNFEGVTESSTKNDIIAALGLDDEHKAQIAHDEDVAGLPEAPAQSTGGSEISEVLPKASEYAGRYRKKSDGMTYALAVVEDGIRGRTHKARNTNWFWEGSRTEFEEQFVKE